MFIISSRSKLNENSDLLMIVLMTFNADREIFINIILSLLKKIKYLVLSRREQGLLLNNIMQITANKKHLGTGKQSDELRKARSRASRTCGRI